MKALTLTLGLLPTTVLSAATEGASSVPWLRIGNQAVAAPVIGSVILAIIGGYGWFIYLYIKADERRAKAEEARNAATAERNSVHQQLLEVQGKHNSISADELKGTVKILDEKIILLEGRIARARLKIDELKRKVEEMRKRPTVNDDEGRLLG